MSGIEREVFQGIAQYWGADLTAFLAGYYADNVPALFQDLHRSGLLTIIPEQELLRAAFLVVAEHHTSMTNALYLALAEVRNASLLVADLESLKSYAPIVEQRQSLHLLWLPDYIAGR